MAGLPLQLDGAQFASTMSARTGIALHAEMLVSGAIAVLRASDVEAPNGFTIHLTTTWRSIEASFRPDNYAGALIRQMGASGAEPRARFGAIIGSLANSGMRILFKVNGTSVSDFSLLPADVWGSAELSVARLSDPSSGDRVLQETAKEVCGACISLVLALLDPEEAAEPISPEAGLPEGAKIRVEVNRYERSPANRAACIAIYGATCWVCNFDFERVYGNLGSGFIEVHHKTKVSKLGPGYVVDPALDLVPLCPNCHSMVHRVDPPMKVEELKALYDLGAET